MNNVPSLNIRSLAGMHMSTTSKLYIGYFGKLPNKQVFTNIDIEQFSQLFSKKFEQYILNRRSVKNDEQEDWKAYTVFLLQEKIMLEQDTDEITILFEDEKSALLREISEFTKALKKEKEDKASINLITMQNNNLDNKKITFDKPILHLEKMYNDDFPAFHQKILDILMKKDRSGLHLLYGKPGTGKSTYIRHLCGLVKKEIVFLPGQMAQNLDNIAMTKYLMDNPNSILVIEDAEELIVSRDQKRNSNLAMILNITDGILGESLGIQIIATFNTDVQNIDPALKRKGRLKSAYEFKALNPEKANILLGEQDSDYTTNQEMTLAEIYNISEEEQYKSPTRKAVGFR